MYLIPKPKQVTNKEGKFFADYNARIVIDTKIRENEGSFAAIIGECIRKWAGLKLAVIKGIPEKGDIYLTLAPECGQQGYKLSISEEGIEIKGGDGAGVMYGVQTLCQITEQCGGAFPCLEIVDSPDLLNRGYYLDQTRGRVQKLDGLKKMVDLLSRYKINEFQLYIEHTYMFRNFSEMWRDETPITAEEILELDAYCKARYVDLVPSLSSFGHLYTLLSTKTYGDLCEMEDSEKQPFSYLDRMQHHTVNVSDERVLPLIKGMIREYMALFSSNKFNICADETFDLGKGKAKKLADEKSVHRIYIDYVKSLCEFLVEEGKVPMFWGDVICGEPELIKELPEETICLNWGYAPNQREDESRKMAEAGAKQYLCPGVCGWNEWMNLIENSYLNITRMCSYAEKYKAVGILNTDWGDFGHINHPDYSIPGMIYGAAFSWNREEIPFEEINRQISKVEYKDNSEQLVSLLAKISGNTRFEWWNAVIYYENMELGEKKMELRDLKKLEDAEAVRSTNEKLVEIGRQLKENAVNMDSSARQSINDYMVTLDGIRIFNEMGLFVMAERNGQDVKPDFALAERLEKWYMSYKEMWRRNSKEGDLHHISDIIFWYADLLRGRKRNKVK